MLDMRNKAKQLKSSHSKEAWRQTTAVFYHIQENDGRMPVCDLCGMDIDSSYLLIGGMPVHMHLWQCGQLEMMGEESGE